MRRVATEIRVPSGAYRRPTLAQKRRAATPLPAVDRRAVSQWVAPRRRVARGKGSPKVSTNTGIHIPFHLFTSRFTAAALPTPSGTIHPQPWAQALVFETCRTVAPLSSQARLCSHGRYSCGRHVRGTAQRLVMCGRRCRRASATPCQRATGHSTSEDGVNA
jgi:hypothetical protein